MKITMYELLGLVKDGKAPNKVKYEDTIFTLENMDYGKEYQCKDDNIIIVLDIDINCLNDEVEIIEEEPKDINVCGSWFTKSEYDKLAHSEEEKKIPEKLEATLEYSKDGNYISKVPNNEQLMFKINEIIDYFKSKGDE